jgi:hypothetical protein
MLQPTHARIKALARIIHKRFSCSTAGEEIFMNV